MDPSVEESDTLAAATDYFVKLWLSSPLRRARVRQNLP
jgi:hypothetical protein